MILNFHSNAAGSVTLTNQVEARQFLANSNRNVSKVDLSNFTECRLVARVVTASASVSSPLIALLYSTVYAGTITSYADIGTSPAACSMAGIGAIDSGWVPLATGARADIFVTVAQEGGDGVADPVLGMVVAHFR